MLEGCTPWQEECARRCRDQDCWDGITLWQIVERGIAWAPDKAANI